MVFADELANGVRGAALPDIQHGLGLSYAAVGLLTSVPIVVGGLLELPLGFLSRRRLVVLGGGAVFVATLSAIPFATSLPLLLALFVLFYPASGAFVSLTQAGLMDAWPERRSQVMARWDLAGSAGAVLGPPLLIVCLAVGGSWRTAYLVLAGLSAIAWLGIWRSGPPSGDGKAPAPRVRDVLSALRDGDTVRWLVLLQVADLLVDVATGFVAVYLVNVAHATPTVAALAVAIRFLAGLGGDAVLTVILERADDLPVLRLSAVAAAVLYPAFLFVPGVTVKLILLVPLSAATACWYPILNARLFGSQGEGSSVAVTLSSVASLVGGAGPFVVGLAASHLGLTWAMAGLIVAPLAILVSLLVGAT